MKKFTNILFGTTELKNIGSKKSVILKKIKKHRLIREILSKQIFDELSLLSKEILNLISVSFYLKDDEPENLKEETIYVNKLWDKYRFVSIDNLIKTNSENGYILDVYLDTLKKLQIDSVETVFFVEFLESESQGTARLESTELIIETLVYLLRRVNIGKIFLEILVRIEGGYLEKLKDYYENRGDLEKKKILDYLEDKLSKYSYTEDLIIFSFLYREIEDILKILNLVAKFLKFKKENSRQIYIPRPLLHRRYRLFNLQAYLRDELARTEIRLLNKYPKFFGQKDLINFLLTSDYDIGDTVNNYGEDVALIKGSFFWREMVRLYPIIMHEVANKLIKNLKEDIYKKFLQVAEVLHIRTMKNVFVQYEVFFSKRELNNLINSILADTISFLIFGDSYILSLISYSGLGNEYYTSLNTNEEVVKLDKKYKCMDFEFLETDVNFNPKREYMLVRLKVLLKVREFLIKTGKANNDFTILDEKLITEIKVYINDLFPVWSDIPTGKNYELLSPFQKKSVKLIANLINMVESHVSAVLLSELKKFKYHKGRKPFLPIKVKPEYVENTDNPFENSIEYYVETKEFDDKNDYNFTKLMYKVSITKEEDNRKLNKFKKLTDEEIKELKDLKEISVLTLIWKVKLRKLIVEEGLAFGFGEGSILRSLGNLKKYSEFIKDDTVLEYDYLNFLKSKSLFNTFLDVDKSFRQSLQSYFKYAKLKNDGLKVLLMEDFSSFFLAKNYYGSDYVEVDLYRDAINSFAFLDRHSIFKDIHRDIKFDKRWVAIFLVKFEKEFIKIKSDENFIGNEYIDRQIAKQEIKELLEDKRIKDYFLSFSLGWEDIILYMEDDSLINIFSFIQGLQAYKIIKRTETIVGYNINHKEFNLKHSDVNKRIYSLRINIRKRPIKKAKEEILKKYAKNFFDLKPCELTTCSCLGRFDKYYLSEYPKTERELIECLENLLDTKYFTVQYGNGRKFASIEDLTIRIVLKEEPNKL